MKPFLYRVAEVFYRNHTIDINNFTFVFPNRRAGLFFQKYLSQLIDKPLFSPDIITINDCFAIASPLQLADRIEMLFRLYCIYRDFSKSNESFDTFAFWGEMLLSDFNEVDRYLVDAHQLFTNVTELREVGEMFDYMTENQINAIKKFWKDFQANLNDDNQNIDHKSNIKEFIEIWKVLFDIYKQFTSSLIAENSGTEGMISRHVAERCRRNEDIAEWGGKQFVFVGFNALNPCEKELMKYLKLRAQADFYWDYEASYLHDNDNPASNYFDENTKVFTSKYKIEPDIIPLNNKNFTLISVPSSSGQTTEIAKILKELSIPEDLDWLTTAIVLPDENLLMPVLNNIPDYIEKVNVTMGYPLSMTPLSGLIESLCDLQKRKRIKDNTTAFYFRNVNAVIQHQYFKALCPAEASNILSKINNDKIIYVDKHIFSGNELLSFVFKDVVSAADFPQYVLNVLEMMYYKWLKIDAETNSTLPVSGFINLYFTTITRLNDVMNSNRNIGSISFDTVIRIIRQMIAGVSVPFTGEPLQGLQIMGVLETRGLDFENIIITSFNEGVFPAIGYTQSFIPHSLRKSFGMPVYEQKDAITSYNFYRLLQRAKNIYMMYDSRSDGVNSGEVSRFLYQLQYHYKVNIEHRNIHFDIRFNQPERIEIKKTDSIQEKLNGYLNGNAKDYALSASSINIYVNCPLQFYLTNIEKLKEPEETKDIPGNDEFGTVFHAVMEYIYEPFIGQVITEDTINALISDLNKLKSTVNKAIAIDYLRKSDTENYLPEGNMLLISEVLMKYLINVLKNDMKYTPFRYIDSEKKFFIRVNINKGTVNIKGFIDRVDEKDRTIRILDYKTGDEKREFKNLEDVFSHDNSKRNSYVLQTMLYGLYYSEIEPDKIIEPGLYFIRNATQDDFSTHLIHKQEKNNSTPVTNFNNWKDEFNNCLTACIEEIFNPEIPFFQTTEIENCKYCSFKSICGR
jgi:hypothetical protein